MAGIGVISFAIRLRFWAIAASVNSSCAPQGPRNRRATEPEDALQVGEPHLDALTLAA